MSKPKALCTFHKGFNPYIDELLNIKFDVEFWPSNMAITKEDLINALKGKFALITGFWIPVRIDRDLIKRLDGSLRVITYHSAGYENAQVEEIKSLGIQFGIARPAHSHSTSEVALSLLLNVARNIFSYTMAYRSGELQSSWGERNEFQQGLENSVVGVIGVGSIGKTVAKKVQPFGIKRLLYYSRSEKDEMNNLGGERKPLEEIMKESDFVVICLSLNRETEGIISKRMISLMKPTAAVVNVARGELIDQEALVEALQNKRIRGAGLDVTTPEPLPDGHPLLKLDNVDVTPHIGYRTSECLRQVAILTMANITAVLEGVPMPSPL